MQIETNPDAKQGSLKLLLINKQSILAKEQQIASKEQQIASDKQILAAKETSLLSRQERISASFHSQGLTHFFDKCFL
jgi:cell division protein FtsL